MTRYYQRNDLPVSLGYGKVTQGSLVWKSDPSVLDYKYYYPIFVDGFRETNSTVRLLAYLGAVDLLERNPSRVFETLPQFILPLKCSLRSADALHARDTDVTYCVVSFLKKLLKTDAAFGGMLMQYCKQLLPPLNSYLMKKPAPGPRTGTQRVKAVGPLSSAGSSLSTEIGELLELLEQSGGKVAASDAGGVPGDKVHDPDVRDRHATVRRLSLITAAREAVRALAARPGAGAGLPGLGLRISPGTLWTRASLS